MALAAGHRVQPRPEAVGFAQPRHLGGGDDESVLDSVRRVSRLAEQGPAVVVQALGILVVSRGQAGRIAFHDRSHDLAVAHRPTVGRLWGFTTGGACEISRAVFALYRGDSVQ